MKFVLALLFLAGVAWSNSTHYYGWTPNKEFVFRFESQVLTGIPEIREHQYGGIKLSSTVRVQTFNDYRLHIKFENSRFVTYNGDISSPEERERSRHLASIPETLRSKLEQPFKVHLKRNIVESFFVAEDEPIVVTNIKKALLSQLQIDISASRRSEIESNHLEIPSEVVEQMNSNNEPSVSPVDLSYFTVREKSVHGDCQTSYAIHPLPKYAAYELEDKWEKEEQKKNSEEHLPGGLSEGKEVCRGRQYWQITKTKNFDNCVDRPVYTKWIGVSSKCDVTKSSCKDLFNHVSATNYVVCGEIQNFVIRKTVTENTIMTTPLGWNTQEKMLNKAKVTLELLREESSHTPLHPPSSTKKLNSLIFEYPERTEYNSRPVQLPEEEKLQILERTGIKPIFPMPDLRSAPKMLVTVGLNKQEIANQVVQQMSRIAHEVFESPESCSSSSDVAGHLAVVAKAMRPLCLDDLRYVENHVMQHSTIVSRSQDVQKVVKSLFYDVLAMVGTNPSFMLIKSKIESRHLPTNSELERRSVVNMLQSAIRAVRTPTKQLLGQIFELVRSLKPQPQPSRLTEQWLFEEELYTVAMVQFSKLLHRACINPDSKMTEFPVRVYGPFCSKEYNLITEQWIPYLERQLQRQEPQQTRMVAIVSLGKLGHIDCLKPLIKIITKQIEEEEKPLTRSLAVYSLKKVARLEPVSLKPLLLSIIENPAENPEVRIAAISVLPWAQPSTTELQKIATRSWFEPSKQVSSFLYSTFKSLKVTEVPELKIVGQKAATLIRLVKPYEYGVQYSHNSHYSKFVEYLKMAVSQSFTWINSKETLLPTKVNVGSSIFGGAFKVSGPTFNMYLQGMDSLIDKYLYFTGRFSDASQKVSEELRSINQKLDMRFRSSKPVQMLAEYKTMGFENFYFLDEQRMVEILEKVSRDIHNNPEIFSQGQSFKYTRAVQTLDVQALGPCDAGFPIYIERGLPIVYALKGYVQAVKPEDSILPTKLVAKVIPVINGKMEAHMGVISPFTHEFIGSGVDTSVHMSTPVEFVIKREAGEISLTIKNPEEIQNEIEVVHGYIKPFTVKKNVRNIQPVGKATIQPILSGQQLKTFDFNFGEYFNMDSRIVGESDAKYTDLYSY